LTRPLASWSRLASAGLGVALFLVVWGLLHHGFYSRNNIVDTPVYERYGEAMTDGRVPYRDFRVEYPPAALPMFVLPALGEGGSDRYRHRFEGLLVSLGVACVLLVAAIAPSLWAPLYVAAAPLALGSVYLSRYDLWPVTLTLVSLAFLVFGRFRLGLGSLGLATAAKVFPAVILPLALTHVWRLRGRREALICAGAYVGGDAAAVVAAVSTLLLIYALVAIWVWHPRGAAGRDRLLAASAAAVCAFVTFGKVLSPQFLIWLVPVVPLVRGRRGLVASGLLAVALVLTQLWFPSRYWKLALEFDAASSWLVLARDLTLVALLVVLMAEVRREPSRSA
jgi:hypothetical protein